MDLPECALVCNRDWDPCYLKDIFYVSFDDCSDLWSDSFTDMDLLEHVECVEQYCPVVEDISLDDSTLCEAVEQIENE